MAGVAFDVLISGQNLDSFGFFGVNNSTSGVGLNTFGFLFPCADIWVKNDPTPVTTWTSCPVASGVTEVCPD